MHQRRRRLQENINFIQSYYYIFHNFRFCALLLSACVYCAVRLLYQIVESKSYCRFASAFEIITGRTWVYVVCNFSIKFSVSCVRRRFFVASDSSYRILDLISRVQVYALLFKISFEHIARRIPSESHIFLLPLTSHLCELTFFINFFCVLEPNNVLSDFCIRFARGHIFVVCDFGLNAKRCSISCCRKKFYVDIFGIFSECKQLNKAFSPVRTWFTFHLV